MGKFSYEIIFWKVREITVFCFLVRRLLFNRVENTELQIMITNVGNNIPTGDIVIRSIDEDIIN